MTWFQAVSCRLASLVFTLFVTGRVSATLSTMATTKQNADSTPSFATDLALVYKPPKTTFRHFIWRWRMLFESTFALSMFEGWEKILIGMSRPDTVRLFILPVDNSCVDGRLLGSAYHRHLPIPPISPRVPLQTSCLLSIGNRSICAGRWSSHAG